MNIGVSTFVMQGGRSGVAAYIRNLFKYLQLEDQKNSYDLLMAEAEQDLIELSNPRFKKTIYPDWVNNPVLSIAWHNTLLPMSGKSKEFDLLHIPSYRRIPLVNKTRLVATVHDLATFNLEAKYDPARMFYNRKIVPSLIRRCDHIITVSNYTKNDLINFIGYPEEKISAIYSGINRDCFQPRDRSEARALLKEKHGLDKPFIVYISRLEHPAKNHVRLIEAFERLKKENDSELQLVFAGADWNGAEVIKARAAQSPVADDIRMLGFAPFESLPLLYSTCELMVYPSLFEGFGFPIVEAMACGAPVCCSNTSSMQEIAGDLVPKFDPESVDEIFESMRSALEQGWTEAQRNGVIEYTSAFDWHKTAKEVIKVYEHVAGS